LPWRTGALQEFLERPTDPFGATVEVSLGREMTLLCARFAELHVTCDTTALDERLDEAYVPAPEISLSRALRLVAYILIGALTPLALALAAWLGLRRFMRALAEAGVSQLSTRRRLFG
jgi:hypothetical protein